MKEVIKYLGRLPENKWQTMVGGWTVHDIAAHLIAWNYEAARETERCFKNGGAPWFLGADNFDDFNSKAVRQYKDFSSREIITELKKSELEMDKTISRCGRINLMNRPGFGWLFDKGERKPHSIKHLDKIKEVLGENV